MKRLILVSATAVAIASWLALASEKDVKPTSLDTQPPAEGHEFATYGAGCFWCVEAVFQKIDGVKSVVSGYEGGHTPNPTYQEVCSGQSGHAEVIRLEFDPKKVKYEELTDLFFRAHDPTQLNRQGADVGTQYRSAIFYHSEAQREVAEKVKEEAARNHEKPIVTEISESTGFYPAEEYHQDYYRNNPNAGYCAFVIRPKLRKLGLE